MIETFLVTIGGVWVALFLLCILVLLLISIEYDSFVAGLFTIISGISIATFVFGIPVLSVVFLDPLLLVLGLLFYVTIGGAYAAFWRYPNYLKANKHKIKDYFNRWDSDHPNDYEGFLSSYYYSEYLPKNNKERIGSWILLWPVGLLWELSHKPFKRVWRNTYKLMANTLEKIGSSTTRKIINK
jgi:hypothetical protein